MAHLDEHVALMKKDGVEQKIGLQCPFGEPSSKPTSWVYYLADLDDMPTICKHQKRTWCKDRTESVTFSKHMPTAGKDTHSLTKKVSTSFGVRRVVPWDEDHKPDYIPEGLAAYADLRNKYLVAKLGKAGLGVLQAGPLFARAAPEEPAARAQAVFKESVYWRDPLRGAIQPTEKEQADAMAIGGLRNTSESIGRLSYTVDYGAQLGKKLKDALDTKPSWVDDTCEAIGTNDKERKTAGLEPVRPPREAIAEIQRLITESVADTIPPCTTARRANVGARLLEGWRAGAKDPETQMFPWFTQGGSMGVLHTPVNVGVFPDCTDIPE